MQNFLALKSSKSEEGRQASLPLLTYQGTEVRLSFEQLSISLLLPK